MKVLGLDWSVVHEEAEALEHALSDRALDQTDALLGNPRVDPHGDPIPTPQGQLAEPRRISLADCPVGVPLCIARVLDQDPVFLQFLERQSLRPGSTVTVAHREAAADAMRIRTRRRQEVSLGLAAAAKVLVEASTAARKSRDV